VYLESTLQSINVEIFNFDKIEFSQKFNIFNSQIFLLFDFLFGNFNILENIIIKPLFPIIISCSFFTHLK